MRCWAVVRRLEERIEELERQVNRNSGNSSMPPSSDPPMTRQERCAEARRRAKESLRKQGGQPGHERKSREMAPPERVDEVFEHLPASCGCGHAFDGTEERLGEPLAHQVWELPPIAPLITEHRRHRLLCSACGAGRLAELPAGVSASAFGPRLQAHIAALAGVHRPWRRKFLGCRRSAVRVVVLAADLVRKLTSLFPQLCEESVLAVSDLVVEERPLDLIQLGQEAEAGANSLADFLRVACQSAGNQS
jgi:transposase